MKTIAEFKLMADNMKSVKDTYIAIEEAKKRLKMDFMEANMKMDDLSKEISQKFDALSLIGKKRLNNRPYKWGSLVSLNDVTYTNEDDLNRDFYKNNGVFYIPDVQIEIMDKNAILAFLTRCNQDLNALKSYSHIEFHNFFSVDSLFLVSMFNEELLEDGESIYDNIYEYTIFKLN